MCSCAAGRLRNRSKTLNLLSRALAVKASTQGVCARSCSTRSGVIIRTVPKSYSRFSTIRGSALRRCRSTANNRSLVQAKGYKKPRSLHSLRTSNSICHSPKDKAKGAMSSLLGANQNIWKIQTYLLPSLHQSLISYIPPLERHGAAWVSAESKHFTPVLMKSSAGRERQQQDIESLLFSLLGK